MTNSAKSNGNFIDAPSDWHADCWDLGKVRIASIIRPSDRRPWAMSWFAIYPNEDVIAFREWPPFDFASCTKTAEHVEDYRRNILESEKGIGKEVDMRFIHPDFGLQKSNGIVRTIRQVLSGACRECWQNVSCRDYDGLDERSEAFRKVNQTCKHKLSYIPWPQYPGSDRDGHMRVRAAIGDSEAGIRPKLYFIRSTTPNIMYGMSNYAWVEEQDAQNEKADDSNNEYPSMIVGGYLKRFEKWPEPTAPLPRQEGHFKARLIPKEIN